MKKGVVGGLRILFVGLPDSIHTARWIGQVAGTDWDLHLFPAYEARPHSELAGLTFHTFRRGRTPTAWPDIRLAGPYPFRRTSYRAERFALRFFPRRMERAQRLAAVCTHRAPVEGQVSRAPACPASELHPASSTRFTPSKLIADIEGHVEIVECDMALSAVLA